MKLLSKTLIAAISTLVLAQGLSAQTTICYKKDWKSPSTIETTKLEGGECKGELSFAQMKKNGWKLKDLKIENGEKGLNYIYVLTDKELISIDNAKFMENKYTKLEYNPITTRISDINGDTASINVGNLRVGQSAIIEHTYKNGKSLIVANAYVTDSNANSSTLKIIPFLDIKQNAIPTSTRKPVNGDKVIVNYLYDSSMIIAPSQDAFLATREKYKDNDFLHADIFAAKLKVQGEPLPSKETIQEFAATQNIGTIFFVIGSTTYIVDSKTFAILEKGSLSYNFTQDEKMPFYTRIEKIEKNAFDSVLDYENWLGFLKTFLGDDERTEEQILLEDELESGALQVKGEIYNNYYKTILGLKDAAK